MDAPPPGCRLSQTLWIEPTPHGPGDKSVPVVSSIRGIALVHLIDSEDSENWRQLHCSVLKQARTNADCGQSILWSSFQNFMCNSSSFTYTGVGRRCAQHLARY